MQVLVMSPIKLTGLESVGVRMLRLLLFQSTSEALFFTLKPRACHHRIKVYSRLGLKYSVKSCIQTGPEGFSPEHCSIMLVF